MVEMKALIYPIAQLSQAQADLNACNSIEDHREVPYSELLTSIDGTTVMFLADERAEVLLGKTLQVFDINDYLQTHSPPSQ